jgi:hypothetical protein
VPWLYNTNTGDVEHQNEVQWLLDEPEAGLVGLHELPIPDSDTAAQAIAYVKAHYAGDTAPTTNPATANANADATVEGAIPGLKQIGGFLGDLSSRNLWLRVAKIIVGLGLILAGVIHLSGAGKDVAVAAGAAAKGAVLA